MESNNQAENIVALWKKYKATKAVELRNKLAEYYLPLVKIVGGCRHTWTKTT